MKEGIGPPDRQIAAAFVEWAFAPVFEPYLAPIRLAEVRYTANRTSPVFEELASILRKTSGLADVQSEALLPIADRIEIAFVFGSIAANSTGANSDIDLMVVGWIVFSSVVSALFDAQSTLAREINPKVYSKKEWKQLVREGGAFVKSVLGKLVIFLIGAQNDIDKP